VRSVPPCPCPCLEEAEPLPMPEEDAGQGTFGTSDARSCGRYLTTAGNGVSGLIGIGKARGRVTNPANECVVVVV